MGALLLLVLAIPDASQVMAEHGDRVVEIQVLGTADASADARTVIGSGFWVEGGLVVTNFHVVSQLVWWPKSHRLQVLHGTQKLKGTLLEIDPPHDLAIIRVEGEPPGTLSLATGDPPRGATLFALGHPHDIGLSIVSGTFNGLAEGELEEQFHFSGSLNPGMSGGPCVDDQGRVVGVNVATMGEQVSFLVPGKWVKKLVERAAARIEPPDFLARVKETVLESQDTLSQELLAQPMSTTTLGSWQLPAGWPGKDLRAWGGPLNEDRPDDLYALSGYQVIGRAMTTLRPGESTGSVVLTHRLYEAKALGAVQLYLRAGAGFAREEHHSPGDKEEFHSRWRCDERAFSQGEARLKSYLCLRGYKKLDGVYDFVLRVMTFDEPRLTVVAELELYGFSPSNAEQLQRHFLEAIQWRR